MARKSIKLNKELKELNNVIAEKEKLQKEAEETENKTLESSKEEINKILKKESIFCGVILTEKDLFNIISLMIETKEAVRIPYNLYFEN